MNYVELMQVLQDTLKMKDTQFAGFLQTDVTTIRRIRGGTAEIPTHTKLLLLDRAGYLALTKLLVSIFAPAAQAKLQRAMGTQALSLDQLQALATFRAKVQAQNLDL